ncbi:MAG: dCTP deaminase domain-containing protein [Candidatus Korobacteraceae bacterium]
MATQSLSLLSGEEIKSLKLVEDSTDENLYRASTYDLSIGDIIPAGPASGSSDYNLPPGGTIRVVSKELLKLPNDITGHALLKNELCRKGVVAINIGVIDPGFQGPLSSILINFGRGDFVVKQGAPFLRISFHRCPASPKADKSAKYNRHQYVSNVKDEVAAYMAPTFLNMEATAKKAAETAFVSFKEALVVWATLVAVLLALLAIFAPLGASYVDRYVVAREQRELQLEQRVQKKVEERYEARLKALSDQVEELKRNTAEKSGHGKPSSGKQ